MSGIPYLALGNSEPLPDNLPPELTAILRKHRTAAGWCDHGRRFDEPRACCPAPSGAP